MGLETIDYLISKLPGVGHFETRQVSLAADTYYDGMLLGFSAAGTVTDGDNTGTGTVTAVTAEAGVVPGTYSLVMTAALVAQLSFNGKIIADSIALTDGAAASLKIAGISMTITDGGTPFVATDSFSIVIATAGVYGAKAADEKLAGIYAGDDARVLSVAGYGTIIVGGAVSHDKLVDATGTAIVLNESQIAEYAQSGFYVKER